MSIIRTVRCYGLVGIINTTVHWLVFLLLYFVVNANQAISNVIAFIIAVTVSFFLNARFTFNASISIKKYLLFSVFMGIVSYLIGFLGDRVALLPIITLIIFTGISFVVGFIWSKFFVFKK